MSGTYEVISTRMNMLTFCDDIEHFIKIGKYWDDDDAEKISPEIIQKFKEGIDIIKNAEIYMHEIDYLMSGDTSEKSFMERLKDKLE